MSRLERLLSLLETGSSSVTRKAAASQLGEVQRLHPHELHNLLHSVSAYIRSNSWETRIAAGLAVEAILKNVPLWQPSGTLEPDQDKKLTIDEKPKRLAFSTFNFSEVVSKSAHLMGSEGKEYEHANNLGSSQEDISKQKKILNEKFGLVMEGRLCVESSSIYSDEDLKLAPQKDDQVSNKVSVGEVVGLSCREMNRLKRKAKQQQAVLMRQRSIPTCDDSDSSDRKRPRLDSNALPSSVPADFSAPCPDNTGLWPPEAVEWPLEWFCETLSTDLFNPSWEVRHGAGTALRHLVKTHGQCGGKSELQHPDMMELQHQAWLEDMALRLVCVLTLDRFGDFVSDQVVAPVRETCSQALGSVTLHMNKAQVIKLVDILLLLLEQKDWETRHGGLLGIKYTFAVREDLLEELVGMTFPMLCRLLTDSVDDVGAVAAAALSLAATPLLEHYPAHSVTLFHTLANQIPLLDDLTPAANTFVPLIGRLLADQQISSQHSGSDKVENLIKRIWSLMAHNNVSVRRAALETLSALPSQQSVILLQNSLRHVFQRALVEHSQPVLTIIKNVWYKLLSKSELSELLQAACPFVTNWLCLAMQPSKLPYDTSMLIEVKPLHKESKNKLSVTVNETNHCDLKLYIGGNETIPAEVREINALRSRYLACLMLGDLSKYLVMPDPGVVYTEGMESPINCYVNVLLVYLNSKSALQRLVAALVVIQWASISPPQPSPPLLVNRIYEALSESVYYDEIGPSFTKLLQDAKDFLALLKHYEVPGMEPYLSQSVFTFDEMESIFCSDTNISLTLTSKVKGKLLEKLENRRLSLVQCIKSTSSEFSALNVMTLSALAGARLKLGSLPEKLGLMIKPLMDSIKKEECIDLQKLSAQNLAELVERCVEQNPSPINKIIANLCTYLCSDPKFTPKIVSSNDNVSSSLFIYKDKKNSEKLKKQDDPFCGIFTLTAQTKTDGALLRRSNSVTGRGPGRPPLSGVKVEDLVPEDPNQKYYEMQRRGATFALSCIVSRFGAKLPQLTKLWHSMILHLEETVPSNITFNDVVVKKLKLDDINAAGTLINVLQVLEQTLPDLHYDLIPFVKKAFDHLLSLLSHPYISVRHMAARCMVAIANRSPQNAMPLLLLQVVPLLSAPESLAARQGATETFAILFDVLHTRLIPYVTFLVIPILGRMSDQDYSVRTVATQTFANLVEMVPLDNGSTETIALPSHLHSAKATQRSFIEQLFNPATIENYVVPVPIHADLRSYQQAGVNWLHFLNRYKLHGILCDDMGLGKTLQSICIVAGDYYDRLTSWKKTGNADSPPLPSLVVCPPTLTGHWLFEVEEFVSEKHLRPLQFVGPPAERFKLRSKVKYYNLIIASYDIVRNDIEFFSSLKWNYCILDEGHIIKNGKTKSTKAIKTLRAEHRLILSGTPIQNNVLELWSLFDFLMPGFLGTEKQFNARFSKPILASRDPKSTLKEQEAGVLAMEALHRKVLPFVLRRIKEDVLKELPPKITQDYYCELSPLQQQLYEDFSKSQAHQSLANMETSSANRSHIFQALRYMQSVCNHPKLALTTSHPQYAEIQKQLAEKNSSLSDINHAAKLPALKQLLFDCGIGVQEGNGENDSLVINQHRALIFCQLKAMLNILENDFFKVHMPSVTYLRLDGSVPAGVRNSVVQKFNNDPSIDVLLLTTQVGGLGLNLTGADTVIFIEHDWSPMRDLQAMDRAHRIGQKKVVNVYRLITKGTLEEKITGLQKFKLKTANTVISSDNASLQTMGTEKLLDLFTEERGSSSHASSGQQQSGSGISSFLDSLPALWEQKDYEEEYDVANFLEKLKA